MSKNKILPGQCKDTGMAMVLILLLIVLVNRSFTLIGVAIGVLVLTMTAPILLKPVARLWFALSHGMGQVVSTVILTVIFFVVVTPISLVRKLLGHDAMRLEQWRGGRGSVFVRREHKFTAEDLEKPF